MTIIIVVHLITDNPQNREDLNNFHSRRSKLHILMLQKTKYVIINAIKTLTGTQITIRKRITIRLSFRILIITGKTTITNRTID